MHCNYLSTICVQDHLYIDLYIDLLKIVYTHNNKIGSDP